jgi:hypothetical protein
MISSTVRHDKPIEWQRARPVFPAISSRSPVEI